MTIFHLALDRANLTSNSFLLACHDCCKIPPAAKQASPWPAVEHCFYAMATPIV